MLYHEKNKAWSYVRFIKDVFRWSSDGAPSQHFSSCPRPHWGLPPVFIEVFIRSLAAELFSDNQEVILIIPLATILYHNTLSLQGHPIAVLQRASATPPSNKEIQNSVKAQFFGAKLCTMTEVFWCKFLISGCSYNLFVRMKNTTRLKEAPSSVGGSVVK